MPDKRRGHNEGSVYYDSEKDRWVAEITIGPGKRKRVRCKTKQEAIKKKNEMLREAGQGTLPTGPNQKLKDYLPDWLEHVQKDKVRISTYVKYKKMLRYILDDLGEVWLQKLTPEQVKRFYSKKLADGLSTKTVQMLHCFLHIALDTAVSWGYVPRNVCDLISPPRVVTKEGTSITVDQAKMLLEQVKEHRLEVLLTTALVTGMRKGELLALRWSRVDMVRGVVVVLSTVDYIPKYGYIETEPKTKTGKRAIHIPPFLVDMLKEHKTKQEAQQKKVGDGWENKDLVFADLHGGYFNPSYLSRLFYKILKDAGLPHMRFHDLRHSTATILLTMGVNIKVIQELLGHSNVSITLGTYSHLLPSLQQGVATKWMEAFGQE